MDADCHEDEEETPKLVVGRVYESCEKSIQKVIRFASQKTMASSVGYLRGIVPEYCLFIMQDGKRAGLPCASKLNGLRPEDPNDPSFYYCAEHLRVKMVNLAGRERKDRVLNAKRSTCKWTLSKTSPHAGELCSNGLANQNPHFCSDHARESDSGKQNALKTFYQKFPHLADVQPAEEPLAEEPPLVSTLDDLQRMSKEELIELVLQLQADKQRAMMNVLVEKMADASL